MDSRDALLQTAGAIIRVSASERSQVQADIPGGRR